MTVTDEEVEAAAREVRRYRYVTDDERIVARAALEAAARVREQRDRDMERG